MLNLAMLEFSSPTEPAALRACNVRYTVKADPIATDITRKARQDLESRMPHGTRVYEGSAVDDAFVVQDGQRSYGFGSTTIFSCRSNLVRASDPATAVSTAFSRRATVISEPQRKFYYVKPGEAVSRPLKSMIAAGEVKLVRTL